MTPQVDQVDLLLQPIKRIHQDDCICVVLIKYACLTSGILLYTQLNRANCLLEIVLITALPIFLRTTSPIPIG